MALNEDRGDEGNTADGGLRTRPRRIDAIAKNICTVWVLGEIKVAPGTFGSIVGVGVGALLHRILHGGNHPDGLLQQPWQIVAAIALLTAATWGATLAIRRLRSFWDGAADDKRIIIDEVIGQALVLIWFPLTFLNLAVGFALFRLFDIFKPWPISVIDRRMTSPFGVVADDLAAAVFAGLILGYLQNLLQ